MEVLNLDPTENSPMVLMDPYALKFEISGESRPENAKKFYSDVIAWLDLFKNSAIWKRNPGLSAPKLTLDLKFDYFNSSSAKYLLDILKIFSQIKSSGCLVNITWHYEALDEDMKESGEEFSQLVEIPFQYVSR